MVIHYTYEISFIKGYFVSSERDLFYQAQFEPELTEREKALRDLFVDEYFYDRDPYAAAIRVGFMQTFARDEAARFMNEVYVRRQIKQREERMLGNNPDTDEFKKKMIEQQLLREANYRGPGSSHAARVSALAKLASLYGMDIKSTPEEEENALGGVMVVPAMTSADQWEQSAATQQRKLKETVKD